LPASSFDNWKCLPNTTFKAHTQKFLGFDGEFHGQVFEDFFAVAVDDHVDRVLRWDTALVAIEDLVFTDFRSRRFVFDGRGGVADFDVGERVRAAFVAQKQRIALRIVTGVFGGLHDFDEAAIAVLTFAGADAFGDDRAAGVLADVDHLRAGVGLLHVVGQRDGIEFADAVVALQDDAGIFPGDGGAGLDLGPGNFGVLSAFAALGHEIVNAAFAFFVAGIPVLDGGVFDLGAFHRNEFDDGSVELVFIAHWRGATFEVADVAAFVGDDQGAFELAGTGGVDAEIGRKFHRATDALGDVTKGTVAEHGAVERGVKVVIRRDDCAEVFFDELRMFADGFAEAAENNAFFGKFFAEGRRDARAVHDGVDGHAAETFLFVERDAEFIEHFQNVGIDLVEAIEFFLRLRRGVVDVGLVIDLGVVRVRPMGLFHREPMLIGFETPIAEKFGFALLFGNAADGVLVEAGGEGFGFDIAGKTVFVFGIYEIFDCLCGCGHNQDKNCPLKELIVMGAVVKRDGRGEDEASCRGFRAWTRRVK
jgi:hypothetical protein